MLKNTADSDTDIESGIWQPYWGGPVPQIYFNGSQNIPDVIIYNIYI